MHCVPRTRAGIVHVYSTVEQIRRQVLGMQNVPWQYNVFHPSTIQYQELQGQNPYNFNTTTSRWAAPTFSTGCGSQSPNAHGSAPAHQPAGPSPSRDQDLSTTTTATSTYTVPLKVLNPQSKKDYTMFTLRYLTEDDISLPESIKEAIFVHIGEDIVSRKLDFQVGFTKKSQNVDKQQS